MSNLPQFDYRQRWDMRFLGLSRYISRWSKDPSTKVGAVIVDAKNRVVSTGYNGFPMWVGDREERYQNREEKYARIVHGEVNAILFAYTDLSGCTLYTWPFPPCERCAGIVIQSGITRVVAPEPTSEQRERWGKSLDLAAEMFGEAGVTLHLYPAEFLVDIE